MTELTEPARVVLDTNVVLSSLLFTRSPLAAFRRLWQAHRLIPVVSKDTISELLRVLGYPKFKLSLSEREQLLADYLPHAETVVVDKTADWLAHVPACRDPVIKNSWTWRNSRESTLWYRVTKTCCH